MSGKVYEESGRVRSRCRVPVHLGEDYGFALTDTPHRWQLFDAIIVGEVDRPVRWEATYRCLVCATETVEQGAWSPDTTVDDLPPAPTNHVNWDGSPAVPA